MPAGRREVPTLARTTAGDHSSVRSQGTRDGGHCMELLSMDTGVAHLTNTACMLELQSTCPG